MGVCLQTNTDINIEKGFLLCKKEIKNNLLPKKITDLPNLPNP